VEPVIVRASRDPLASIRATKIEPANLFDYKGFLTVHGVVFAVFVFEPLRRA
jgi:hypothetical protein